MQNVCSRFATKEEMINDKNISKVDFNNIKTSGLIVGYDGENYYMDNGGMHNLVIGSTGSGKTQSTVLPLIKSSILASESFISIDVKGELYNLLSGKLKNDNYNTIVIDFSDKELGNNWNPFTLITYYYNIGNKRKANTLLRQMAEQLFYNNPSVTADPFWNNCAQDYFIGLTNILLELKKDNITLLDIYYLSEYSSNNKDFFNNYFKDSKLDSEIFLSTIVNAPTDTRGSIISVFKEKINRFIVDEKLMNLMSNTNFDIVNLDFNKTALFIMLPEYENFKELYTILIRQMYDKIVEEVENNRLNSRVNIILDDYDKCSPISNFDLLLSASRAKNIRFTLLLQSLEVLYEMYGKELGNKVKYQFGNVLYLLSNSLDTLEEISEYCGNDYENNKRLITVEELRTLRQWQAVLIKIRQYPFITELAADYTINWGFANESVALEKRSIVKTTDYQEFIGFMDKILKINDNEIDINELVRKIDAKINELES